MHPFYRDGAYMVAVLNIHGLGDSGNGTAPELGGNESRDFTSDHAVVGDVIGSRLGAAVAYDPVGKIGYWVLRRGPAAGADSAERAAYIESTGAGEEGADDITGINDRRAYIYYPAPPAGVTKIDLRLGGLGTVHDVPIQ